MCHQVSRFIQPGRRFESDTSDVVVGVVIYVAEPTEDSPGIVDGRCQNVAVVEEEALRTVADDKLIAALTVHIAQGTDVCVHQGCLGVENLVGRDTAQEDVVDEPAEKRVRDPVDAVETESEPDVVRGLIEGQFDGSAVPTAGRRILKDSQVVCRSWVIGRDGVPCATTVY